MKKSFTYLTILVFFASCSSQKNYDDVLWDNQFELCSEIQLSERIQFESIEKAHITKAKNIYPLFENFLLNNEVLDEVSIEGYKKLMHKTLNGNIDPEYWRKFSKEIGFESFYLFANPSVYCFGYPFPYREKQLGKSKDTWQYEYCLAVNKIEAEGGHSLEFLDLIYDTLDKIPEEKFSKEIYRRYYLNTVNRYLYYLSQ